jgi:hypothetical protein
MEGNQEIPSISDQLQNDALLIEESKSNLFLNLVGTSSDEDFRGSESDQQLS